MYQKNQPYIVDVKSKDTVYICQCGKTNNPPYCDGSHTDSGIEPLAHTANSDETLYVCGCGKTGKRPFCDGSHQ